MRVTDLWMVVMMLAAGLAGCSGMKVEAVARPQFSEYHRVAVWGQLDRVQDELFIPLYMKAFKHQQIVERRDLLAIIGEQDLMPDRLDHKTRAKIREIFGVEAIVFPNYTDKPLRQLSVKVIDTANGEIVAAVVVIPKAEKTKSVSDRDMIRKAIDALKDQAHPYIPGLALPTREPTPSGK